MTDLGTWEELDRAELKRLRRQPSSRRRSARSKSTHEGWPPDWRTEPPSQDLFGIALSGGGIRSATFNLGVLQELAKLRLLGCFDYLSTVSGGGYVGGFWSAWLARERERGQGRESMCGTFPECEPTRQGPEPTEARHLREFSNFLRPRASLLSIETARIFAVFLGGVGPCVAIAFSVLTLMLSFWWGLSWLLTGDGASAAGTVPWIPIVTIFLLTIVPMIVLERTMWRRSVPAGSRISWTDHVHYYVEAVLGSVIAAVLGSIMWLVAPSPELLLTGVDLEALPAALGNALTPATPWLATSLLCIGLRLSATRLLPNDWPGRTRLAELDRVMTRLFLFTVAWCALGVTWVAGQLLAEIGVSGVVTALGAGTGAGALFSWIRHRLVSQGSLPATGERRQRLGMAAYRFLAYLAVAAVAAAAAAQIVLAYTTYGVNGLRLFVGFAAAIFVLGLWVDPHEIGLHKFYRARLARAFLGASNAHAYPRSTAEAEKDDIPLEHLEDRPFHLICCAANDLSGDPLGSLNRGAETAVASKLGLQVGDRWRQWSEKTDLPWLSDVLTASGAAFNSHMGQISTRVGRGVTFLLAALGLRLGLWLENPRPSPDELERWARERRDHDAAKSPDRKPLTRRPPPGSRRRAPGYLFLRELFGLSDSGSRWVHLSDGAHFENLALYELIRRHCRFILLSDCGADPDRAFDDFGNVVRRVREDFGVEIEIDIAPLKASSNGRSQQPMVAGDIHYPPERPGGKVDDGILLYIKPTLTGKEPADITQYARRNREFPHERTIDQFYDEAQWESYRQLGRHVIHAAFSPLEEYYPHRQSRHGAAQEACGAERLFLRARFYWPATLTDGPNLDRLEKEWNQLEARLSSSAGDETKKRPSTGLDKLHNQILLRREEWRWEEVSEQDLVDALPVVRESIRLMEAVFCRTGFSATSRAASSRTYMGWLNRFGVWATAPIFRAWWPWIAPFYSGDFTAWMVATYHLPAATQKPPSAGSGEGKATVVYPLDRRRPHGYAWARFATVGTRKALRAGNAARRKRPSTLFAIDLLMDEASGNPSGARKRSGRPIGEGSNRLNAAVVFVQTVYRGKKKIAFWWRDDHYVAHGLWGLGVGELFLEKLLCELEQAEFDFAYASAKGTSTIYEDSLYTGAGFHRRRRGGFVKKLNPHSPTAIATTAARRRQG